MAEKKGRQQGKSTNNLSRKQKKTIGYVLIAIVLTSVIGGVIWKYRAELFPNAIGGTGTTITATTYTFAVEDYVTGEKLLTAEYDISVFKLDTTGMTQDEIDETPLSGYTLDATKHDGDTYTPSADEVYLCKLNGSDIREQWIVPDFGVNLFRAVNMTEDIALVYWSDQYITAFNQTTNRTWNILTAMLDADGEKTEKEGISSYYDYNAEYTNTLVLRVEFNETAQLSWVNLETPILGIVEKAAGNYVYYEIPGYYFGEDSFQIKLGSTIGTDFEAIGLGIGYGSAESMTVLASGN